MIIDGIKNNPYFKCLNTTVGYCELEIEFIVKNMDSINDILDDLEVRFPDAIRNYFFFRIRQTHKER
jgi:hypothetical protein